MMIYPLSLAVYCTSWTFFGSVGLASRQSTAPHDLCRTDLVASVFSLILKIVRLAKTQNITSIADFHRGALW